MAEHSPDAALPVETPDAHASDRLVPPTQPVFAGRAPRIWLGVLLASALVVLFYGLGKRGLWDPWEMNEADIARTLTLPGEVYGALSHEVDEPTRAQLLSQVQAAKLSWRELDTKGPELFSTALDTVRTMPVAALLADEKMVLPHGDADGQWPHIAQRIDDARAAIGHGSLLIVSPREAATLAELKRNLEGELANIKEPRAAEVTWDFVSLRDPQALEAALNKAHALVSGRASFKHNGEIRVRPPLESWLVAASYDLLGISEWSSRLPGALMGLATLLLVVWAAAATYGWRVGILAGAVLISLPLFYTQSRLMMGSSGLMLAFTALGSALLLHSAGRLSQVALAALLVFAGFWGLLSDGVFAVGLMAVMALTLPLTKGAKQWQEWVPGLGLVALALVAELWAQSADPGSWAAGLRFYVPMFSEGYDLYHRTFDLVIRALGFGLAPWSPIVVIALSVLTFSALQRKDLKGVVIAAWFFIATAGTMAGLKTGNHYLFVGVGGAAVAVALMLSDIASGQAKARAPQYFVAAVLVMMFYILRRELKPGPEPLVSFLAFDPPFAKEGPLRFPESLTFDPIYKSLFILAALTCLLYFGKVARAALKAVGFVRRHVVVLTSAAALMASFVTLYGISRVHNTSMGSAYSDSIRDIQRALPERIAHPYDPVMSALFGFLAVLLVVLVLKALGSKEMWQRLQSRFVQHTPARPYALWTALGGLVVTLVVVAFTVKLPPDSYLLELLFSPTSLAGGLTLIALGGLLVKLKVSKRDALVLVAMTLLWGVTAQLVRDANVRSGLVAALSFMSAIALTISQAPRLFSSVSRTLTVTLGLLTLICLGYCLVLADRALWVVEVVYASEIQNGVEPASLIRRSAFLAVPVVVLLGLAFRFGPTWLARLSKQRITETTLVGWGDTLVRFSEHRFVVLAPLAVLAVWGTGSYLMRVEPAVASHVSQKHILDHWLELEGDTDNLFKHGAFGSSQRKDTNFYTAGLPDIRDRQSALRVLHGDLDQVVETHTPYGPNVVVLPGFQPSNDENKDGIRDEVALRGFLTEVGPNRIIDAKASFEPNALVGKRVGDHTGRSFRITANDATSITYEPGGRASFALSPKAQSYYTVDSGKLDQRATGEQFTRRGVLLPTAQLSELNFAYRQLSKGQHLPILEANSRVMLASSVLKEGEAQQNPLALATYNDKSFAELKDPRIHRVWGTFEDSLQVVGYRTDVDEVRPGQRLELTVYYKVLKPVKRSLKIFVHLDKAGGNGRIPGDHWPLNPTRHSEDNKNCTGCYRTDHWFLGDIVADTYAIDIPESATGTYTIWVGLFQPGPDTRMPVTQVQTGRTKHDGTNRLSLGEVRIR